MATVAADRFRVVLNNQKLTVFGEYRHDPDDQLANTVGKPVVGLDLHLRPEPVHGEPLQQGLPPVSGDIGPRCMQRKLRVCRELPPR